MSDQQVLSLLGLAKRAGKLIAGEDSVLRLLKLNKLKIVFVANDASEKQKDKFIKKSYFYKTQLNNDYSCDQLSSAIGKPMCKILGITDQGFLDALNKSLNGGANNEG